MAKSILISSFIMLCATVIETAVLSNISFLYVVPDLVLICSIYFSVLNGKFAGETTGFVSGLILDFMTGIPFGFNCLFRTIIGYGFGIFTETIIFSGFVMPMLCVAIGTFAKYFLTFLISLFFPNVHILAIGIISKEFLFELVLNVILAPAIFKFLGVFKKSLAVKDIKEKVDHA